MFEIDKRLHQDIKEYCKLNGLVMKDFVNKLLKKAFTIEKYGETPFGQVNEVQSILPIDYETPEPIKPVIKVENPQDTLPVKTEDVQEEPIIVKKSRKRKLN